jgi:hypothetical protein
MYAGLEWAGSQLGESLIPSCAPPPPHAGLLLVLLGVELCKRTGGEPCSSCSSAQIDWQVEPFSDAAGVDVAVPLQM